MGEKIYICSCGFSYIEFIQKLPHAEKDPIIETVVVPTCTVSGLDYSVVYCSVCTEEMLRESIETPALGHIESKPVKEKIIESVCTENGSYEAVVYCTVCKTELSRETKLIPAKGHRFGAWEVITEPTMTEKGEKFRTCSECGVNEAGEVPATGITVTVTDADGKVVAEKIIEGDLTEIAFNDLEDGEYTVTVEKQTFTKRTYTVSAADGEASLEFKLNKSGDVTGDDKVNTIDVARANAQAKGVSKLTDYELACADVNGDGKVNTIDVARMNSHAKGVTKLW